MTGRGKKLFFASAAAILAAEAIFVAVVASGVYSVAASKRDNRLVAMMLRAAMKQSVRFHARHVDVPNVFAEGRIATGFAHYDDMCVECHGAPGVRPKELAHGLNPKAPDLAKTADEWSPAETYWIIRHGIRMTGMAAFEGSHDDIELWALAAFVKRLPKISPADYTDLRRVERTRRSPLP